MGYDESKEELFARKLVEIALAGNITTYGELCNAVGLPNYRRALRCYLARIGEKCNKVGLPLLPAIVVNKTTRAPGIGIFIKFLPDFVNSDEVKREERIDDEQKNVHACADWSVLLDLYK